jgi:D-sedoheptulose 7-phosphate isomerase
MKERIERAFQESIAAKMQFLKEHRATLETVIELIATRLLAGNKLLLFGNGGSAADAQHIATEYVVRYQTNRPGLRAVALTTDTSLLTACANDMGFDEVFARQVEALTKPEDLLVLHSTSGESPNVVRAAQAAKARGVPIVAFLGKGGGQLKDLADLVLIVPSDDTARIQELHLAIEHVICEIVEDRMQG